MVKNWDKLYAVKQCNSYLIPFLESLAKVFLFHVYLRKLLLFKFYTIYRNTPRLPTFIDIFINGHVTTHPQVPGSGAGAGRIPPLPGPWLSTCISAVFRSNLEQDRSFLKWMNAGQLQPRSNSTWPWTIITDFSF